jgi:hypothetical protein
MGRPPRDPIGKSDPDGAADWLVFGHAIDVLSDFPGFMRIRGWAILQSAWTFIFIRIDLTQKETTL